MKQQSFFALFILLASFVSAFEDAEFSNFLYQNRLPENGNLTISPNESEILFLKYNRSEVNFQGPIRGSIMQSQDQLFTYRVNTSTGVGEKYLPLVFLTGNICSQPKDPGASANESLTVYVSYNESDMSDLEKTSMYQFKLGYFQALTVAQSTNGSEPTLYVLVRSPESTNSNDTWTYEIGVSQNDLMHQWDHNSYVEITDTDATSALITTKNLTMTSGDSIDAYNISASGFDLLVFDYKHKEQMISLNNSWCALKNGPVLLSISDFETSYTSRRGGLHQQFHIEGLNSSTKYIGVLLHNRRHDLSGGVVYSPFEFETQNDDACSLIYDLEFCDQVAYAVPASSLDEYSDRDALKQVYDDRARSLFTNFSKSLQQIVCNTTSDASFSPLGSCEACNASYKNWLCSVTIPRCSTRMMPGYLPRSKDDSRNSFIDEHVKPPLDYYEVLPCLNVCHILVRDCPADFGFDCPSTNATVIKSYYWDTEDDYATCNFVGVISSVTSASQVVQITWSFIMFGIAAAMFL